MLTKFGIVLFASFLTTIADEVRQPVKVVDVNGCALKYMKDVPDKPDIFITTVIIPGVCRLQKHQHKSTENYETFKIEYYRKQNQYEYGDNAIEGRLIPPNIIQKYNATTYQGLNYDVRTKSLIYVDGDSIKRNPYKLVQRRLNDSQLIEKVTLVDRYPNLALWYKKSDDFAYDWRTKNLYINQGYKSIVVINVNKTWQPVVLVHETSIISSLAIHPNAGYLFYVEIVRPDEYAPYTTPFTASSTCKSTIHRTYLDGSNKRQIGPIVTDWQEFIKGLVIDYHTDRLYWTVPHLKVIQSANLDGSDVKDVIHQELNFDYSDYRGKSIYFDKKYVYYISNSHTIHRLDKKSMKKDEDFEISNERDGQIFEMMIYDPEAHKITTDHPCLVDNGGCDQYCLARPKDDSNHGLSRTCRNSSA